jgi:hypothetical protein
MICDRDRCGRKKEQGAKPCSKNCVDPVYPANSDLLLIGGATLLLRVRVPPETWTTRLSPFGEPEAVFVDEDLSLVIIFGNECSNFMQISK